MRSTSMFSTILTLGLICGPARSAITFSFEGGEEEFGSQDLQGFGTYVNQGFVWDVAPTGAPNFALHFHELITTSAIWPTIPDRPVGQAGALWRDGYANQDPLFLQGVSSTLFRLNSLIVGTDSGALTTAVRLFGYRNGALLGSVDLVTPSFAYTGYSGVAFGGLSGMLFDRLEFVGIASSESAAFLLDNVVINPVPEPATCSLLLLGLAFVIRRLRI